ncbi:MAG: hypothetical protein U9N30_04655 [Campylobacterota bacterium]|nr:hypothetical protein [Campylobacterota bacterium]
MGNKTLIYQQKLSHNLKESQKHLKRLNDAFLQLQKQHTMPLNKSSYQNILNNLESLAYSDQIIYRFSKLQDCMGAKLFKSILLFQGENVDKPFLDILNQLEKMDIIEVEEWFELRDLRNDIAHDYEENDNLAINILNMIYKMKQDISDILKSVQQLLNKEMVKTCD